MNKVILMGRLTREPDVRYSTTGAEQLAIARYTLAIDRRYQKDSQNNNVSMAKENGATNGMDGFVSIPEGADESGLPFNF